MEVLVAGCHEADDLVPIDEKGHILTGVYIPVNDHLMEGVGSLTHKIVRNASYGQRREGEITEFHSLVHHVHSCEETTLYVVLNILGSDLSLMHKRWVLGATACSKDRGMIIIILE